MNFIKRHRIAALAIGLVVVVAGFLAFRPDKLFVDDVVDESLADAFGTATTVASGPVDDQADVEPEATVVTAPDESDPMTDDSTDQEMQDSTTVPTEPPAPSGPVAVTTGDFYGIDHTASGTATVYEQDGEFVLRFEDDTDIQNGPDLFVWVLPAEDFDGSDPTDYIDLGKLKGNIGGQNYQLPDDFDPDVHQTVMIWCLRFNVPFAAVPLG